MEGSEGQRDGLEDKEKGERGKSDVKKMHMRKGGKDREMDYQARKQGKDERVMRRESI